MINTNYFWLNISLLAFGTLAIRLSLILLSKRIKISDRIKELFSFIPAAILPAFIAPAAFYHQGQVAWMMGKERLVILALATALAYFTRSTLFTIVFGLIALFAVTQLS